MTQERRGAADADDKSSIRCAPCSRKVTTGEGKQESDDDEDDKRPSCDAKRCSVMVNVLEADLSAP